MPDCAGHSRRVADGAADAVIEEEGFGEDVGGVKGADADGDDVVEGGGGADVDEANSAGDARHDHGCAEGDSGVGLDLWRGSRYFSLESLQGIDGECNTLLIVRQKGKPLSRPNAKTMRDEVARKAIAAQMSMIMMMEIIVEAPAREPVASWKICIKGKPRAPVGLASTSSMSTVTNSTTITMAEPRIPLSSVVNTMHQGITTLAPRISSAIYERLLARL